MTSSHLEFKCDVHGHIRGQPVSSAKGEADASTHVKKEALTRETTSPATLGEFDRVINEDSLELFECKVAKHCFLFFGEGRHHKDECLRVKS